MTDLTEFLLARIAESGRSPAKVKVVARAAALGFDSSEHALRLAAEYHADHPDFREEWRP